MCEQRKMMWLMAVMVVMGYTSLSLLSSTKEANAVTRRQMNMTEEEKRVNMIKEEEEEKEEETAPEEEKNKQEEKEKKKDKEETKVQKKGKGGKVGVRKIGVRKNFWVNQMEEYSPSSVNMDEMEEEMRRRRRRVEERCKEILTEERKEINSKEFLISKKYKLIWCNIFKAASSTWLYNYLRMAGRSPEQLKNLSATPVEAARHLYPRPSPEQLRDYLGKSSGVDEDAGEDYLSFIIVREPFQRLLSSYRDKIEKILPYYRSLRCEMTQGVSNTYRFFGLIRRTCTPSFPQFVDYVLKTEKKGGAHNEHWAPYYRFCTPCSTHFDLILRFESLHQDEAYLLEKVPGLSKVVSPMVIHSSHTNYSSILAQYYRELTPAQMLGLIKMYLPDFWLFGYNERPYLDLVL